MKTVVHWKSLALVALATALAGLAVAGCGGNSESGTEAPPPPDYKAKLAGSPAPLAALHEQGNELLPGGVEALGKRMAELKGFPVVVNIWASWCGPCRSEFPLLQKAAADWGKKVAFLGLNSQDDTELATNFLADYPVPYPSYLDPDGDLGRHLGWASGLPTTIFYNADGERTLIKSGEFPDQEDLDEHIREYAIQGDSN